MKKLLQFIAAFSLPLMMLGGFAAAETCTLTNTGPGSTNTCAVYQDYTCKINNNNQIIVENKNGQEVASGSATVGGNTTGGGATSGTASNNSGTTYNVNITNGNCAVASVVTPEVTPTPTPTTPTAPQPTTTSSLPYTAGTSQTAAIVGTIAGLGIIAAAAQLGVAAYRRIKS